VAEQLIPLDVCEAYEVYETLGASAVLRSNPAEWDSVIRMLRSFYFTRSEVWKPAGGKTPMAKRLESHLRAEGWVEGKPLDHPLVHRLDGLRGRVGVEVQWCQRDYAFDRDMRTFRFSSESGVVDVGVVVTRGQSLHESFRGTGKFIDATTHMGTLVPLLRAGYGKPCPVLAFGITRAREVNDDDRRDATEVQRAERPRRLPDAAVGHAVAL